MNNFTKVLLSLFWPISLFGFIFMVFSTDHPDEREREILRKNVDMQSALFLGQNHKVITFLVRSKTPRGIGVYQIRKNESNPELVKASNWLAFLNFSFYAASIIFTIFFSIPNILRYYRFRMSKNNGEYL